MLYTTYESDQIDCPLKGGNCNTVSCAFWRWGEGFPDPETIDHPDPEATKATAVRPARAPKHWTFIQGDSKCPSFWSETDEHAEAERRQGYCGLAGLPFDLQVGQLAEHGRRCGDKVAIAELSLESGKATPGIL